VSAAGGHRVLLEVDRLREAGVTSHPFRLRALRDGVRERDCSLACGGRRLGRVTKIIGPTLRAAMIWMSGSMCAKPCYGTSCGTHSRLP
jgi:hypothetical protein